MVSDIESFYPSISEKNHCKITDEDINLIMQARKTLLFNEGITWVKTEGLCRWCRGM